MLLKSSQYSQESTCVGVSFSDGYFWKKLAEYIYDEIEYIQDLTEYKQDETEHK